MFLRSLIYFSIFFLFIQSGIAAEVCSSFSECKNKSVSLCNKNEKPWTLVKANKAGSYILANQIVAQQICRCRDQQLPSALRIAKWSVQYGAEGPKPVTSDYYEHVISYDELNDGGFTKIEFVFKNGEYEMPSFAEEIAYWGINTSSRISSPDYVPWIFDIKVGRFMIDGLFSPRAILCDDIASAL